MPTKKKVRAAAARKAAPKKKSKPPKSPQRPDYSERLKLHRIVVKFRDEQTVPYTDGYRDKRKTGPWKELEAKYGRLGVKRVFTHIKPEDIRRLSRRAQTVDPLYRAPDFLKYFHIELTERAPAEQVVRELKSWDSVETAYVDLPSAPAQLSPSVGICANAPGHLNVAPEGIDAAFASQFAGGKGAGQYLVDIEEGWTVRHRQLRGHGIAKLFGTINNIERPHGTAVLGIACGKGSTANGCRGIAPGVKSVRVCSCAGDNLAQAIWKARIALSNLHPQQPKHAGGVLLIEHQLLDDLFSPLGTRLLPVETMSLHYWSIRDATADGTTVIEAAGNGFATLTDDIGFTLDPFPDPWGNPILGRGSRDGDSGAIMVGSAVSDVIAGLHERMPSSNFGKRVDCYAWGNRVLAASSTDTSPYSTTICDADFGGTSAAAAIVAGVALVVLGVAFKAQPSKVLQPLELRAILSDLNNGTLSTNHAIEPIGVMPDLARILTAAELGVTPLLVS